MNSIYDVANYFIKRSLCNEEVITPQKVQALSFLVVEIGKTINISFIEDDFLITQGNIKNKGLSEKYIGLKVIRDLDSNFNVNSFSQKEMNLLDYVWNKYGWKYEYSPYLKTIINKYVNGSQ